MNANARSTTAVLHSTLRVLSERETQVLSGKAGVARETLRAAADDREALPNWPADRVVGALWPAPRRSMGSRRAR